MTISLKGKIAVVTGASGQLGRVITRTLASCGADVAVNYYSDKETADLLVSEIKAIGGRAVAIQADITDESAVNRMRDEVKSTLGDADVIINNAVLQYKWTSILEQSAADFQSQFDSCVMQSVLTAKAFLPAMMAKGEGRFIGINTICSALCHAASGAYSSAKRGMDGLYRVLSHEAGPGGVTVNQVSPGSTISYKDRERDNEPGPEHFQHIPLRRRGTDQEVANVVLFLASDLASYLTGVNIPVTGGLTMV